MPHGMWDRTSPAGDQTPDPCIARWTLYTCSFIFGRALSCGEQGLLLVAALLSLPSMDAWASVVATGRLQHRRSGAGAHRLGCPVAPGIFPD